MKNPCNRHKNKVCFACDRVIAGASWARHCAWHIKVHQLTPSFDTTDAPPTYNVLMKKGKRLLDSQLYGKTRRAESELVQPLNELRLNCAEEEKEEEKVELHKSNELSGEIMKMTKQAECPLCCLQMRASNLSRHIRIIHAKEIEKKDAGTTENSKKQKKKAQSDEEAEHEVPVSVTPTKISISIDVEDGVCSWARQSQEVLEAERRKGMEEFAARSENWRLEASETLKIVQAYKKRTEEEDKQRDERRRIKEECEKKFREMMEIQDRVRAEERERMKRLREENRGTYLQPGSSTKARDNERNKRRCFG